MSLSRSAAYSSAVFAASILGKVLPLTSHLLHLHLTLPLTPYTLRCTSHTVTPHTGQVGCGCGLDGPHAKWVGMAGTGSLALRSAPAKPCTARLTHNSYAVRLETPALYTLQAARCFCAAPCSCCSRSVLPPEIQPTPGAAGASPPSRVRLSSPPSPSPTASVTAPPSPSCSLTRPRPTGDARASVGCRAHSSSLSTSAALAASR